MKKLMILLVAALGVSSLFAKCACPGDKLTGAPSWAPAPLKALTFETGGDAKWTTDNVESNSVGVAGKVLRSGAIAANQASWAQVRVKGAGRLTFSWKVSSQAGGDKLAFDVCRACTDPEHCKCCKGYSEEDCSCAGCEDERAHDVFAERRDISGLDGEWETVTIEFRDNDTRFEGDGSETNLIEHIVRWTYVKNEVLNRGEDCGWLDNVTWASAGGNLKTYENCELDQPRDWADKWMSGPGETITVTFDTNGGQYTNELESAFKKVSNGVYKRSDFKFAQRYFYEGTDPISWEDGSLYEYYSAYSTNIMTNEFGEVTNFTQVVTQFPTNEIVRKGYEFLGWYTSKDGLRNLGEPVFEDDPVSPTNITLYARWRQVESDKGLDLFHGLGFGAMKDGAQKTCIAETLTTNEWIACAKGGVDGGKMAMNMPGNSSFAFDITNDTGTATGTDGVLSFDWRVTEDALEIKEEKVTYGWWATEAFTTNDVGEYVVKVVGFKPRFVSEDSDTVYPYETLWSSADVERAEDDDAGTWKYAEAGSCRADPNETLDYELLFDDDKYMTTNAIRRVMVRRFQVRYTRGWYPLQAAQIAKMTWTPVSTVKVVFDANGGTVEGKAKYEKEYAPGYAFDFEEADSNLWNNVKHPLAGAEFAGWWTEPFGGEDAAGDDYALPCTNGVVTLFAHWTIPVADAIGLPGQRIVGDDACCSTNMTWFGIVGAPDGVPYAARSIDIGDGESAWMETVFDVKEDSFLTFKWMVSSQLNLDLFSLWVDGVVIADISGQTEWEVMRVLLAAGTHTIKWEYAKDERGEEGDDAAYLADVAVSKVDLKNLVDWLDVLHADGYWETNKLAKFAAAYTNKFTSAKVDEVARARFGHAICTVLALGENAKVLEALHDAGYGVAYQPYDYTNFLNYAFGDYANKQVVEHLESIKGESDNDRYMKFANEAIAAYKAAIADLDAITNGWKGSFTIAATGKHLDNSGEAYTNDVVVDIADINMVKANFNGMLSQIQFVGAHDMTLDHDKVIETITTRPAITRTPKMSGSYMCIGGKLLKANEENLLIDEETRARNKAYILKTYGDGSEWDIVPALPLKSAPYAEVEQSGSVQIAMCGGTSVSAERNSNRLYFKVDANTVDDSFIGKALVATFIDEIADKPVTVTVNLGSDWENVQWHQIDNNFEVFKADYPDASARVNSEAFGGDGLYSVGASSIGNTLWVEVDLGQNDLGEYAEYHPLHWTIFSVQVLESEGNWYDRDRSVVVSEAPAPSMTGNADDWKRVKAYSISGDESIADSLQCVRDGTNVYIRLTGLDPKFDHTFESLYVELDGENYGFGGYVDTEKVVFTGNSVEICFIPPGASDSDDLARLTLGYVACACSDEDDEHPRWNAVSPYAWAAGDISEDMRWHSVLTHYEDITAVLKEQPDFLANIRDNGLLGDAKETMRAALTSYLAADDGIEARTDDAQHLYWHAEEQKADLADLHVVVSNALAALDAPRKVNFALLSKALGLIGDNYEDKYLDGPRFTTFIPDQMKCALQSLDFQFDGDVNIDLSKLFETGLTRNFLPQFEDCWPVLDTLPDPTFGGLFPEMTLGEWLGSYMGRGIISLDTYNEVYPHMTTKMPSQLKVRQYVNGEGYVTFTTDLREAMPNAHISCSVDGIDQAVTEFAPSHVSSGVWVKGKGEHEIVWTIISGGLTEETVRSEYENVEYGMYWYFDPSWYRYGLRDADYRQQNVVVPLKNVVFSEGLKLIAKRRSGGSVDFGFDDDTPFVVGAAQTFQGELLEDGKVIGSVTVKVDKKGVVSATVNRMDGTKTSYKKGVINEAGIVEFEGGLMLTLGTNKLSGSIGEDLEIAGVRNVFASKDEADKAKAAEAMAKWQNTYVFAMEAINPEEAGPFVNGYGVFTLTVGKNGKSKLQGFMPDGTKVSYSTQMLLGEEDAHVPLSVSLYKNVGGFGMDIVLGEESSLSVAGASGWKMAGGVVADWALAASGVAIASAPLPGPHMFYMSEAFAFEMDCCEEALPTEFRPEAVSVGSNGKWAFEKAAKVANVGGEWAIDDSKGSNLSGLKLSYKAATGLFKGTFVVYALEGGKVKKYKATVNGAEIEGAGYGSAVIKDKGVAPVMINMECDDCTP